MYGDQREPMGFRPGVQPGRTGVDGKRRSDLSLSLYVCIYIYIYIYVYMYTYIYISLFLVSANLRDTCWSFDRGEMTVSANLRKASTTISLNHNKVLAREIP